MTVATRLLIAGGGSGGFPGPTQRIRAITAAPHGGWTLPQGPKAIADGNITYIVWTNGTSGDIEIGAYDYAGDSTTVAVLAAAFEPGPDSGIDNHSSPAVIVLQNGHIMVAASHHAEVVSPHIWVSPNPHDISGTWTHVTPGASIGAAQYTYMILVQVTSGRIFLWFRDFVAGSGTGRLSYSTSDDNGATWSARHIVYTGASGHVPYWKIQTDWDTLMHVFTTDIEPTSSQLGHFYLDATTGKAYTSAGVEITASRPFGFGDITTVHAATCWSWGGSIDPLGRPATILMQDTGSDNAIKVARYRSGAWHTDTVIASVGGQVTGNQYASGCGIHPTNPDLVTAGKKVGSHWEQFRYVSHDDGSTWTGTQLTSGSSVDNIWADFVQRPIAGPGLENLWLKGTYTSDTAFDFGISGWG